MNLQKLGMIRLKEGIYAKVVKKGACTAEFNNIIREVGSGFKYLGISADDEEKLNGYAGLTRHIKVDYKTENLIIIITNETD